MARKRSGRHATIRSFGLLAAAALLGLGAWQVAQPTDASPGDVEVAADTRMRAPTTDVEVSDDPGRAAIPGEVGFGADDEVPNVVQPPTVTEPAETEPTTIVAAPAIADPISVAIPVLGVTAPVDRVALEADGSMEIPHDIARVGWYEPGVRPGETGSAVIAGHVDSRTQGRGALWGLKALGPGDTVNVGHQDGRATTWRVTSQTSHLKEQLPIGELFTRFGDRRLVLITCGGSFDAARGRYTHNIVVIAEPVDAVT